MLATDRQLSTAEYRYTTFSSLVTSEKTRENFLPIYFEICQSKLGKNQNIIYILLIQNLKNMFVGHIVIYYVDKEII